MIKVSVIIPVYNGKKYLKEAIDSVIAQTYQDWEIIVVNEFGSNDGSSDIIKEYCKVNSAIHLVQNEKRLGLAESLNRGISLSEGEYIARLDADDVAYPDRFMKQVKFMDKNPEVIVCGTYQHHFGVDKDWVHRPAEMPEQCKANLLFFCDLCHSTLMLRKKAMIDNNLWYDKNFMAEDFELWTRVLSVGKVANIPEVLGKYRWGDGNITNEKIKELHKESGYIVGKSLERNLGLKLENDEYQYFCNWRNPLEEIENKQLFLEKMEELLRNIYEKNNEELYYDPQALLNAIGTKWRWIKYNEPFNNVQHIKCIDQVFKKRIKVRNINRLYFFWINNRGLKLKSRKIIKKLQTLWRE